MSDILRLYRGDTIFNERTKPAIYRSEGIVSSAFGSNAPPDMIERLEFLNSVKIHIDHILAIEKEYYKITDYISFTESEDVAKKFASYNKTNLLESCDKDYFETRYIFKVEIPINELIEIARGVYEFVFTCNTDLKKPYKLNQEDEFEIIAHTWALRYNKCPICNGEHKSHKLRLVNPMEAFKHYQGNKVFKRSIRLAEKNSEWLILPNDIIDHGFRSTRISLSDFWGAKGYIMVGEEVRNPYVVPYPRF